LGEFGDQGCGLATGYGGGIDLGCQKNGSRYVRAAFEAVFFGSSRKIK
jgi:hypothetical protein